MPPHEDFCLLANQKGGVGKTTTNLIGWPRWQTGQASLIVDLDPQECHYGDLELTAANSNARSMTYF